MPCCAHDSGGAPTAGAVRKATTGRFRPIRGSRPAALRLLRAGGSHGSVICRSPAEVIDKILKRPELLGHDEQFSRWTWVACRWKCLPSRSSFSGRKSSPSSRENLRVRQVSRRRDAFPDVRAAQPLAGRATAPYGRAGGSKSACSGRYDRKQESLKLRLLGIGVEPQVRQSARAARHGLLHLAAGERRARRTSGADAECRGARASRHASDRPRADTRSARVTVRAALSMKQPVVLA